MEIKSIRQLVKLMIDNHLNELKIVDGDQKVHLRRGADGPPGMVAVPTPPAAPLPTAAPPAATAEAAEPAEAQPEAEPLIEIRSPMVGTLFSSPSPDSDAYVQVGDAVSDDSVVCIVEAMKVMNEIRAECVGTIAEVCVQNAQPVEFGQVLFRVRPSA